MTREEVYSVVQDVIVDVLPSVTRGEVRGGVHTKDLGADSVDRIEIISTLLERLGVKAELNDFASLENIDQLVDQLQLGVGG